MSWSQCIVQNQGQNGSALTNSSAATTILPALCNVSLGSGWWNCLGKRARILWTFEVSTPSSSAGTLTIDLRMGSSAIWTTGAITLLTSQTNAPCKLDVTLESQVIGTSGKVMGLGTLSGAAFVSGGGSMVAPTGAPGQTPSGGFDMTQSWTINSYGTFSNVSSSLSITVLGFEFWDQNVGLGQ
jgi:hypothetical protein